MALIFAISVKMFPLIYFVVQFLSLLLNIRYIAKALDGTTDLTPYILIVSKQIVYLNISSFSGQEENYVYDKI
jgi:hypothetical protein